jgi:hypothetical protein
LLPRSSRSRIGTCIPTENISIAKPTLDRKSSVPLVVSSHWNPVRPITIPAAISPTTTGRSSGRAVASAGPARPTHTISASTPKLTPGA